MRLTSPRVACALAAQRTLEAIAHILEWVLGSTAIVTRGVICLQGLYKLYIFPWLLSGLFKQISNILLESIGISPKLIKV